MTLIIGASCAEGAVLLADSLEHHYQPGSKVVTCRRSGDLKIGAMERAGVAYAASGFYDATAFEDFGASDFRSAARRVADRLARFDGRPSMPESMHIGGHTIYSENPTPEEHAREVALFYGYALIVATLTGEPRLAMLTSEGEQWDGQLFVSGAAHTWWTMQPKPAPRARLWECEALVLAQATAFKRFCYKPEDYLADQGLSKVRSAAPVMPPFHGLTITPKRIARWQTWQ